MIARVLLVLVAACKQSKPVVENQLGPAPTVGDSGVVAIDAAVDAGVSRDPCHHLDIAFASLSDCKSPRRDELLAFWKSPYDSLKETVGRIGPIEGACEGLYVAIRRDLDLLGCPPQVESSKASGSPDPLRTGIEVRRTSP